LNVGTGGQASQTGGSLVGARLLLLGTGPGGGFTVTSPTNQIGLLAASTNAFINFRDSTGLLVGVILGTNGITTGSNGLDMSVGGSLTVDAPINAGTATIAALVGTTTPSAA